MVPAVGLQLTSAPSTPILLSQAMPEMTEKAPLKKQHRKKNRETHNAVERHRKKKINAGINKIGELIPCSPALKQSKNMILDQAYKYITEMKRQNDELLLNGGNNEQAEEIKKLRKQLDELQKENGRFIALLKANDICLYDDPTIHWKGNLKNAKVSVVIPNDQGQKKKGNLKSANISVVIPNDQLQKNIIVYSNGSQLNGSNQGASIQGITFNISPNLQKQTANVVPVQRTCNLVTPVSIYSTEMKSGSQFSVSPLAPAMSNPAKEILEHSASENEQNVSVCTTASSVNVLPVMRIQPEMPSSAQEEDISKSKNRQESFGTIEHVGVPNSILPSNATVNLSHSQLAETASKEDSGNGPLESCSISTPEVICTPLVYEKPPTEKKISISEAPAADILKPGIETHTLPATTLSKWPFPSSSVGSPGSKGLGGLARITSAGNTQTTWTTLQLTGNTVQPVNHTLPNIMTALLNEPVSDANTIAPTPSRILATTTGFNNLQPAEEQTAEQIMAALPSYPSLPMQPLVTKAQVVAQPAGGLLSLNSAMQVIQMPQPVGPPVAVPPANQNVVILQPPNASPCPPVLRTDLPNQTVSQQIVIIQTANPNPLSLFSAPPPARMPMNGASLLTNVGNSMQNSSSPQMFGGKHLVHILPRPSSSSPSSGLTQTVSVAMSNQQLPQTISLNGQLFALKPVKSCSGNSDQIPMQIIQPTTSEDPNTNVALNTFGALANLNQSISQMAGQSCLKGSAYQPVNPSAVSSQSTPSKPVLLPSATVPSSTSESSVLISVSHSEETVPQKSSLRLSAKCSNKNPSTRKCSMSGNNLACQMNSSKDSKKLNNVNADAPCENSVSDSLLENIPANALQNFVLPQTDGRISSNDANASESQSKEGLRVEQHVESVLSPDLNATVMPQSLPLVSSSSGQFEGVVPVSTVCDSPPLQTCTVQTHSVTSSELSESSKCISNSPLPSSSSISHLTVSQTSVTSVTNGGISAEKIPRTDVSDICRAEQNCSIVMQATDLLEEQGLTKILSDFSKVGEVVEKNFSVEHTGFCTQGTKSILDSSDELTGKEEGLLLMNTEEENLAQTHSCPSEQETVAANRQADSPMSTSSGSSCGFSVASMLPGTCRESVPNSTLVNTCNNCTFSEQTDIVALAARAIFDQETLIKETRTPASKANDVGREQSLKSHITKNVDQIEIAPNNFNTQNSNAQNSVQVNNDRSAEKQSCSIEVEMSNTALQIPTPQSSSTSSLSVNNLIHQTCIIHPAVSCSSLPSPSNQAAVPVTQSMPVNSYMNQSPGQSPALMTEYASEQLSALQTSTMQAPLLREPQLKQQGQGSRKESAKRAVQDDHLLSSSKRQKQCQTAPLQLEDMGLLHQTSDDIVDQNQILVNQIPNSSNLAVTVNSQGHTDGHSRLFPSSNFVSPALRQAEVQCNSQPSVSDQAGQHLPTVQHTPAQSLAHLHSNHPYIKQQQQQQQAGQLRERHQLYQLQHHISHTETSIHSQAHITHQQRVMHQEVQMQKKRTLIQAAHPTTHPLQQKHHGNDQRSKTSQPHSHHSQLQQMQQHYASSQSEKSCENPTTNRSHHSHPQSHLNQDILHQQSPDVGNRQSGSGVSSEHVPGHSQIQRLMTSRALEQQMVSQPSIVTRPSDMACVPHRQERNRVSSYSAEALIGKSPSNSEQRLGISIQSTRAPEHLEMRNFLDVSRNKGLAIHNMQGRMSVEHTVGPDVQRLSECQTFKTNGTNQQSTSNFDVQSSRNSEIGNSMPTLRAMQTQAFRIAQNAGLPLDRQKRLPYQPVQGISSGNALPPSRDNENTCHQGFMQSLLVPHLGDQSSGSQRPISEHQRNSQCASASNVEYNCSPARDSIHIRREGDGQNRESCDMTLVTINSRNNSLNIPFSSSGDIQGRNSSPNISAQKSNPMRMTESHGTKGHMNAPVSSNVHGIIRSPLQHPPVSRGNADQVPPSIRQPNSSATQRSRHPLQDGSSKVRQPERNRSGNQRHGGMFDPSLPHLPLAASSSMILGRQQPTLEKRSSIVRFMSEGAQVSNESAVPDQQSLSQNFGFSFIPENGMNPPINANTSFIPPVTQSSATRTPALIPVDPQNTLPSFYPPYSPAHPSLSNDISLPYFSNQMFSNPSTEKPSGGTLNNRFGSILSPPRPVGFAQPSFPLLTDMPPMHMANSSHLSNFNLTSLFPEIATALPSDGSAISPLLSITNTASDTSKQSSNRPAHNISHILGHDCSSAV
ncbi:basic helix-loop-helix domain-containing protein USF3 isoform X1 [Anolis carolinensis]|uniref:Upstream transcription factor family member 3 n=1 Tax=Anolis carolinensis TaxID=28377 RepID=H9GV45_ANOCA|nr:PREDICTED: basic helix-loop-helix domain-containing protein USF3 isoform X1 [Anolis carolinensis]|eukprot:XP_003227349.2 PREDICTED: basic helix-loop-helix domain-containing protein USF3 isoform X1 [Anolis carolinensis]